MKLNVSEVPVNDLRPNPWNTNTMTPENEVKVENSLKRFGFIRPVIARRLASGELEILGGEHRWKVARKLGYETVPVIVLDGIDDMKAKEIGLVDNGRYGEDDPLQLAELLKDMGNTDDILSFLPYTGSEIDSLFSISSIALDELDIDDSEKLPELSTAKAAQTHQIMRFKVPLEDSEFVQQTIETIMRSQGFTGDDSMTNAGDALVYALRNMK